MEEHEQEIWKDIPGYESRYQASTLGRIKSLNYKKTGKQVVLKTSPDGNGYCHVTLWKDKKGRRFKIGRLILMTFVPNPLNLPTVEHKDRNRSNDILENLEWATQGDNNRNRDKSNFKKGEDNNKTVLTKQQVLKIKELRKHGLGKRKIAKLLDITPNQAQSGIIWWKWLEIGE